MTLQGGSESGPAAHLTISRLDEQRDRDKDNRDNNNCCELRPTVVLPHYQSLVRAVEGEIVPRLLLALGSGSRDESQFADGDTFDIRRENASQHLAFGWGRQRDQGADLAVVDAGRQRRQAGRRDGAFA